MSAARISSFEILLRDIGFARPREQSMNDAPVYPYEAMEGASKG